MTTRIITHRGLDPDRPRYFAESSREAFEDQLTRGFGLEFDIRITKDNGLVILHDADLLRISKGKDPRKIRDLSLAEILSFDLNGSHIIDFPSFLKLLNTIQTKDALSAMHLKYESQEPKTLNLILDAIGDVDRIPFIIFDASKEAARYLKDKNPSLHIAPSIAHPYDVARYNDKVRTLYTPEEVISHRDIFDWVWLDEWDLADKDGGIKHLYIKSTFDAFRAQDFSIGLVSPELHASSPGLIGGEVHPEAGNLNILTKSIKNIISLHPDIICTDHPDLARSLIDEIQ